MLEMLLRPAEFTHASDKFEFTTKEFGASGVGRSLRGPYHFVGWAVRWPIGSQQLEFDWLAPCR